ncbi:hypothetical protein [Loktanella sp. S4079]|uniref:hypothetical protein n=1 Tax=Loktanella sp. S4079 TaxID=579483 RepID=UPI0005F9E863|nr:hypothetical protein [Loktanella sp. S4079]KJZ20228.1 hypothetical protein TW80_05205 [Loktanella sp. S4079]
MTRRLLATAIALLSASPVIAGGCRPLQPDGVAVLLGSHHIQAQQDFNEFNPGVFLSWDCDIANPRVGVHRNSMSEISTSISFTSDFLKLSKAGFDLHPFFGFAHYPGSGDEVPINVGKSDIIPIVGLELTHEAVPAFIQYLPGDVEMGDFAHLWTFGLKFDLNK